MLTSEWLEIAAVIRERWPSATLPVETLRRWGEDLRDVPAEHVVAAVEVLYREGREFPPHAGQIRAKLSELMLDEPDWHRVLEELRAIARTPIERIVEFEEVVEDGHDALRPTYDYPRERAIEAATPLVRAFIGSTEWDQIAPALSDHATGSDEARLREKWRAFVRSAQREVLLSGIPAVGLPTLKRIERGDGPAKLGRAVEQVRGELAA